VTEDDLVAQLPLAGADLPKYAVIRLKTESIVTESAVRFGGGLREAAGRLMLAYRDRPNRSDTVLDILEDIYLPN